MQTPERPTVSVAEGERVLQTPDRLTVSVAEAARLLSVSRPTMYEILNRADCNADFKLGSRRLVNVAALKEWVDRQTQEAAC